MDNRSVSDYRRALNPRAICVIVGFSNLSRMLEHMILGPLLSRIGKRQIGFQGMAAITKNDLMVLKKLIEIGKTVPAIGRSYPLSDDG